MSPQEHGELFKRRQENPRLDIEVGGKAVPKKTELNSSCLLVTKVNFIASQYSFSSEWHLKGWIDH